MAVVIAVVAVVAGLASSRRPTPGIVVIGVLGLLGLLAVITGPAFTPVDLAAPAAALVVGIDAFRGLHALAIRTYVPAAGGPAVSRRLLLVGSSAAVAVVSLAAGWPVPVPPRPRTA